MSLSANWTTGIFGCCVDKSGACETLFCLPCQIGRHCQAIENDLPNTPSFMWCCISILINGIDPSQVIMTCCLRGKLRARHGIEGGCCGDMICALFCGPCAMCQQHRELTIRARWPGGTCCQTSPPTRSYIAAPDPLLMLMEAHKAKCRGDPPAADRSGHLMNA